MEPPAAVLPDSEPGLASESSVVQSETKVVSVGRLGSVQNAGLGFERFSPFWNSGDASHWRAPSRRPAPSPSASAAASGAGREKSEGSLGSNPRRLIFVLPPAFFEAELPTTASVSETDLRLFASLVRRRQLP